MLAVGAAGAGRDGIVEYAAAAATWFDDVLETEIVMGVFLSLIFLVLIKKDRPIAGVALAELPKW